MIFESIQKKILWFGIEERKRLHLISWEEVCRPKRMGGLGIRKIRKFNQALLSKHLWNLLLKRIGWSRIYFSKYIYGIDHFRDLLLGNFIPPTR